MEISPKSTNEPFPVPQLSGRTTFKEKVESKFAEALGHIVTAIQERNSPLLRGIQSNLVNFLNIRNEMIDQRNAFTSSHHTILRMNSSDALEQIKDLHSKPLESLKGKDPSFITDLFLNGIYTRTNELKEKQRNILARVITERIDRNIKILENSPNMSPTARANLENFIRLDREVVKTLQAADFKKIAQGKVKNVYIASPIIDPRGKTVTYVARNGIGRQSELDKEVHNSEILHEKLAILHKDNPGVELNLVRMEKRGKYAPGNIGGKMGVTTGKAGKDQDLKKYVDKFTFQQSVEVTFEILNGMNNLHLAGALHGDLKDDNILIFEEEGKYTARVSDYGKMRTFKEKFEKFINTGNYRYIAPEGGLSQKTEVYSTAILMIKVLENELLKEKDMVIGPTHKDEKVDAGKRKGIEKFLIQNKDCPQTENTTLRGLVKVIKQEISSLRSTQKAAKLEDSEREVHAYIEQMIKELSVLHPGNEDAFEEMGNLLKEMTRSDTDPKAPRTPNLSVALQKFEVIKNQMVF